MPDDIASICQKCGASIYKAHLDSGIARYEGGNLLCAHCVSEYERSHAVLSGGDTNEFEAITLDDEDSLLEPASDMSASKIMASTQALGVAGGWDDSIYKRPLLPKETGATRCRMFHCKLSENSLVFMSTQINEWIDGNDEIVIKFVTSGIGMFEGKHSEPNLIVTVFY